MLVVYVKRASAAIIGLIAICSLTGCESHVNVSEDTGGSGKAAAEVSQDQKPESKEKDDVSATEATAQIDRPLNADEAKRDGDLIYIKRGDQYFKLTTCPVDDKYQGTLGDSKKPKDETAEMPVINVTAGDELAMFSRTYNTFRKVVDEGYVYPDTVWSSENLSFQVPGASKTPNMVEIDGVEVDGNSLDILASKDIYMNDRFFLVGPKGTSFTCGYYEDTKFIEETYTIDTKMYFLEKAQSTFSANGLELEETKTKEGYSLLDASVLEPGTYSFYREKRSSAKDTTFLVQVS